MKLLIWDFDGTLAYREGMWSGALLDVLNQHAPGHTITRDHIRPHLRQRFPWHTPDQPHTDLISADDWWAQLTPVFRAAFTANGFTPEQAALFAPYVRAAYCHPDPWSTYPETMATLAELVQDGWTHVILSNHIPELADLVQQLGLNAYVSAIFNSAQIGYEKPHPAAFQHVLARIQDVEQVWMIGDNPIADIAGAAAVGIPGILVRKSDPMIVHCCDDLAQVRALINRSASPRR